MMNAKLFDPADVSKMFSGFTFPAFDMPAVMASQRKNLEALTQANQLAAEGFRAMAQMQVDFAREAIDEASSLARDWAAATTHEARLQKQADFARQALSKGVDSTRELIELAGKTQAEAFEVLNRRFTEGLDEFTAFAKKESKKESKAARQ